MGAMSYSNHVGRDAPTREQRRVIGSPPQGNRADGLPWIDTYWSEESRGLAFFRVAARAFNPADGKPVVMDFKIMASEYESCSTGGRRPNEMVEDAVRASLSEFESRRVLEFQDGEREPLVSALVDSIVTCMDDLLEQERTKRNADGISRY